jgi:hypothetical protein
MDIFVSLGRPHLWDKAAPQSDCGGSAMLALCQERFWTRRRSRAVPIHWVSSCSRYRARGQSLAFDTLRIKKFQREDGAENSRIFEVQMWTALEQHGMNR